MVDGGDWRQDGLDDIMIRTQHHWDLCRSGPAEGGRGMYRRALDGNEKALGPDHTSTLTQSTTWATSTEIRAG